LGSVGSSVRTRTVQALAPIVKTVTAISRGIGGASGCGRNSKEWSLDAGEDDDSRAELFFSPDGKVLALGSGRTDNRALKMWQLAAAPWGKK